MDWGLVALIIGILVVLFFVWLSTREDEAGEEKPNEWNNWRKALRDELTRLGKPWKKL